MRTPNPFDYPHPDLAQHWARLHAGDGEPFPTAGSVTKLAQQNPSVATEIARHGGEATVASALEDAWRRFHRGDFATALRAGAKLGPAGVLVANKAAALHTLYVEKNEMRRRSLLRDAVDRGDAAVAALPEYANAHYALAMALGRYSQRISILEALAAGHAKKISLHLERTLEIDPRHAEAHLALGLYHAELLKTLGSLPARLTYGASEKAAIDHFRRALRLAPKCVVTRVEYAHGLRLIGADSHRAELDELRKQVARLKPMDRMEQLDLERMLAA